MAKSNSSDMGTDPISASPGATIAGISGSPRKDGNSDKIMNRMLQGAKSVNCPTQRIYLRDYDFTSCIGCEKCRPDGRCRGLKDGMHLLYPEILKARGLVLVSPTHHYNVTAWVKAFIDRLYCYYIFTNDRPRGWKSRLANQGRMAVIGAICEQPQKEDMGFTLEAMRLPLEALGYSVLGSLPVINIFDKGKVAEYKEIMDQAEAMGKQLGRKVIG